MAYCRITHSALGRKAINYVLDGKPHNSDKYVMGRVLSARGVNCTVNNCCEQMKTVWGHFHIRKGQYRVQRLIVSFDPKQLNYKSYKDRQIVQRIGTTIAKRLYPRHQSIVVEQADGKNHILHLHIISSMLNYNTGHALSGRQTMWRRIQPRIDKIIVQYHNGRGRQLDPERNKDMTPQPVTIHGHKYFESQADFKTNDAEYHIKARGGYSWGADIKSRVKEALFRSINLKDYINKCRKQGVSVNAFRKNGKLKKRTSYSFIGKDKRCHHIRSPKLGYVFNPVILTKAILPGQKHDWIKRQRQQAQKADNERNKKLAKRYSIDKVMPKLRKNARWAMLDQIPLLPTMIMPQMKRAAWKTYDDIDHVNKVKPDDKSIKRSWFQDIINAWNSLKIKWRVFKKATKKWYHRAKLWLTSGFTPGHGGVSGGKKHDESHKPTSANSKNFTLHSLAVQTRLKQNIINDKSLASSENASASPSTSSMPHFRYRKPIGKINANYQKRTEHTPDW